MLHSSCYSRSHSCWGNTVQESLRLHCFRVDRDEIWQDYSSSKCASMISNMTTYFQDGSHDVISQKSLRLRHLDKANYSSSKK